MENHVKLVPSEYVTLEKQSLPSTLTGKGTASEQEQLKEGGIVVALEEGTAEEEKQLEEGGMVVALEEGTVEEEEQLEEGGMAVALEEEKTEEEEEEVDVKKTGHRGTIPVR